MRIWYSERKSFSFIGGCFNTSKRNLTIPAKTWINLVTLFTWCDSPCISAWIWIFMHQDPWNSFKTFNFTINIRMWCSFVFTCSAADCRSFQWMWQYFSWHFWWNFTPGPVSWGIFSADPDYGSQLFFKYENKFVVRIIWNKNLSNVE